MLFCQLLLKKALFFCWLFFLTVSPQLFAGNSLAYIFAFWVWTYWKNMAKAKFPALSFCAHVVMELYFACTAHSFENITLNVSCFCGLLAGSII